MAKRGNHFSMIRFDPPILSLVQLTYRYLRGTVVILGSWMKYFSYRCLYFLRVYIHNFIYTYLITHGRIGLIYTHRCCTSDGYTSCSKDEKLRSLLSYITTIATITITIINTPTILLFETILQGTFAIAFSEREKGRQ